MPLRTTFSLRPWRDAGVCHIARGESDRNVKNLAHAFAEEVRSSMVTTDLSLTQLRLSWLRNPEQFGAIVAELDTHLHASCASTWLSPTRRGRCCTC